MAMRASCIVREMRLTIAIDATSASVRTMPMSSAVASALSTVSVTRIVTYPTTATIPVTIVPESRMPNAVASVGRR